MNKAEILAALLAVALVLAGCGPRAPLNKTDEYILPEHLKDCSITLINSGMRELYVVRCPNSTVSTKYQEGKTTKRVITVDGETYERIEQHE